MNNLRYAIRQLRKSPGFTFSSGANTAIFTVVHAVVVAPLPLLPALHASKADPVAALRAE